MSAMLESIIRSQYDNESVNGSITDPAPPEDHRILTIEDELNKEIQKATSKHQLGHPVTDDMTQAVRLEKALYEKGGIVYITPGTKNPKLIVECNDYSVYLKQNDKTRWRCNAYFKTKCKATLLTYGKVVRMNHQHNHYPMLATGGFDRSYPQREEKRTRWRCTNVNKTKCNAVCYTYGNTVILRRRHNHPPKGSGDLTLLTSRCVKIIR
nr:unnamed protein product [Callosobruchus chinensis]